MGSKASKSVETVLKTREKGGAARRLRGRKSPKIRRNCSQRTPQITSGPAKWNPKGQNVLTEPDPDKAGAVGESQVTAAKSGKQRRTPLIPSNTTFPDGNKEDEKELLTHSTSRPLLHAEFSDLETDPSTSTSKSATTTGERTPNHHVPLNQAQVPQSGLKSNKLKIDTQNSDSSQNLLPCTDQRNLLSAASSNVLVIRLLMRLCVDFAKEQRERVGRFRREERHNTMELYDIMGLEQDVFLAPPNDLQVTLSHYRFPPPEMQRFRSQSMDFDSMAFMLGNEEALKRQDQGSMSTLPISENNQRPAPISRVRRAAVSSEANGERLTPPDLLKIHKVVHKTPEQRARLTQFLSSSVLFKGLDKREFEILCDAFAHESYAPDERIIEQGGDGDNFYVIDSGRCEIVICDTDGTVTFSKFIGEGESFGELGVMYGTPRVGSVYASTRVSLWVIDRDTYRSTIMQQTLRKRERYMHFIDCIPIFSSLEGYEKIRFTDVLDSVEGPAGWIVMEEGTIGDSFYLVEDGELVVSRKSIGVVKRLFSGDYFGELALLNDTPRQATVEAVTSVRLVLINRSTFTHILGPLEHILRRNAEKYQKFLGKMESEAIL